MNVRRATIDDIPKLIAIAKDEKGLEDFSGEYTKELFLEMFEGDDTTVLVVEDEEVIGFVEFNVSIAQERAYLESIAVSKQARKKGIATKLIEEVEKAAKEKGCKRLTLFVREWNSPMLKLMEKLEYKEQDKFIYFDKML